MSVVQRAVRQDGSHAHWLFWCPACSMAHACDDRWDFNGNVDAPSFLGKETSPGVREPGSVLVVWNSDDPARQNICHSFVRDGKIQYCDDCTHEMRGQTVDLPPWRGFFE